MAIIIISPSLLAPFSYASEDKSSYNDSYVYKSSSDILEDDLKSDIETDKDEDENSKYFRRCEAQTYKDEQYIGISDTFSLDIEAKLYDYQAKAYLKKDDLDDNSYILSFDFYKQNEKILENPPDSGDKYTLYLSLYRLGGKEFELYEVSDSNYQNKLPYEMVDGKIIFESDKKNFLIKLKDGLKDNLISDSRDSKKTSKQKLTLKSIKAKLYADETYSISLDRDDQINISGLLPEEAKAYAYPVDIEIEGKKPILSYDIKIYDKDDKEIEMGPKNDISVSIKSPLFEYINKDDIEISHQSNKYDQLENVQVLSK